MDMSNPKHHFHREFSLGQFQSNFKILHLIVNHKVAKIDLNFEIKWNTINPNSRALKDPF